VYNSLCKSKSTLERKERITGRGKEKYEELSTENGAYEEDKIVKMKDRPEQTS